MKAAHRNLKTNTSLNLSLSPYRHVIDCIGRIDSPCFSVFIKDIPFFDKVDKERKVFAKNAKKWKKE